MARLDYLLAVLAPAYPIDKDRFAIESAFAMHLKVLSQLLTERFDRIVLVAPTLSEETYERSKGQLAQLSAASDRIALMPIPEANYSPGAFWLNARPLWRRLRSVVRSSGFVHTGMSSDIRRPFLTLLNLAAWVERRPSVFMIDIDFRQLSQRYYKLGIWGRKSYLINRVIHDQFKIGQVKWAIGTSELVLLKSKSMVHDLGKGRPHVKFFLDAAHADGDVISDHALAERIARFSDLNRDLQVVYFGRLVPYKGCEYMIEAIAAARAQGARVNMTFVGDGEVLPDLKQQVDRLGITDAVAFLPAVTYGRSLFDLIDQADLAIASPKVEDTPRAALDAMARGLPILAFDIDYFKSLADASGAVALATWPNAQSLADVLKRLDEDRSQLASMSTRAISFARANSQDKWLKQRLAWTLEAIDRRASTSSST